MFRTAAAFALAGLAITPVAAQQAANWVQVSVDRPVVVEANVGAITARGALRVIPIRMVSPDRKRSKEMAFAIDCKAHTLAIDGEARSYDDGKLTGTETPPEDARAQQSPRGAPEFEKVIELACAAKL